MQFSKLFGVTVLVTASSAQAQDPCTEKYAGYMPRTDQNAYWTTDTLQATLEGIMGSESCPDVDLARNAWNSPSTEAAYLQSIPTQPLPISKEWEEYTKYYGSNTFHIDWVNAAFSCDTSAGFTSEVIVSGVLTTIPHPFDPNFDAAYCGNSGNFVPTPTGYAVGASGAPGTEVVSNKECVGIEESVKKATSYVYGFIEMVQLMERAIKEAKDGCNMQTDVLNAILPPCTLAMEYWDAAAAIFTGSLEGEEGGLPLGGGSSRVYGKTLYTLGEKRCRNFATCAPLTGNRGQPDRYNPASINSKIMQFFAAGSHATYSGDKRRMEFFKRKISAKVMVPWTQGVFRYAHRLSDIGNSSREHKEIAEASTFALGALPKLWACSTNAALKVAPLLQTGRVLVDGTPGFGIGKEIDYIVVKNAFECNYRCLDITCEEVGSLYDVDVTYNNKGEITTPTKTQAEACKDSENLSGDKEKYKCIRPNSKYIRKCRDYTGKSGISKRTNFDYLINGL